MPHWERIDAVLARAAAKEPEERFPSAGDVGRALAAAIAGAEPVEAERNVATGAALSGIATQVAERVAPVISDPAPTVRAPRGATVSPAVRGRRPPLRRRATTVGLWVAALALVGGGTAAALLIGRGSSKPSQRVSATTSASPRPVTTRTVDRVRTVTAPARAAVVTRPLAYRSYVASQGGYTTVAPTGGGWRSLGETAENPRLLRSTFVGPGGAQIWVDATPQDAPTFSVAGRHVTAEDTIASPLGPVEAYSFSSPTPAFCSGGCVDYQLDLGGAGYAVLGGPSVDARSAARRIVTSLALVGG